MRISDWSSDVCSSDLLTAVRAFLIGFDLQAVVAATHAALRGRGFSLGDGHDISCILKKFNRIGEPGFVAFPCVGKRLARPPRRRLPRLGYAGKSSAGRCLNA